MNVINTIVGVPLGWLLRQCVNLIGSYGWALVVFTLLTKVILLPLSLWVQKNSIKMIKLKPRLNEIEAEYGHDRDRMSELQLALYKEENYRPMAGVVPMLIQVPIILGLISVIYNPMQHILCLSSGLIDAFLQKAMAILGTEELGSGAQITVMKMILDPAYTAEFAALNVPGENIPAAIEAMKGLNMYFLGWDLSATPSLFAFDRLSLIPWLSGLSAFLLCVFQNKINVLQKEASFMGRWGMAVFLTAFSLYFASLVPAGVGIYWICGNIFAILMLYVVNGIYPPKKYIDYEALEESKKHLAESRRLLKESKLSREDMARSKADYKRFTDAANEKQIVFYSESSGFYKYFHRIIDVLLRESDVTIHYVTSDPKDAVFSLNNPRLVPYFIDNNRLIMLFMLVDADIMVMTMPDLQTYHLKRSYVRKDTEYIYLYHGIMTSLSTLRDHALDAYDTIFFGESHQRSDFVKYAEKAGLPERNLVNVGYGVLDDMIEKVQALRAAEQPHTRRRILIAPSWQPDNILESCLLPALEALCDGTNEVIIRPHPQYLRRFAAKFEEIKSSCAPYLGENCRFETDFSSNETVYTADILMTDWSGIAYEYAFATERPVLFVHTPMKVVGDETQELSDADRPDVALRSVVGRDLMPEEISGKLRDTVEEFTREAESYRETIVATRTHYIYNLGHSGEVGAAYILKRLDEYAEERRRRQEEITV